MLLSTVKFVLGGVPLALAMGFPFFKTVVTTCVGGFIGVLIFVNVSEYGLHQWHERKKNKKNIPSGKKKFTRTNKIIIKAKSRFGLIGIAFLTPFLLSIPVGSFVAMRYFKNKNKVIIYLFASVVLWSVSLASLRLLFKVV